MGPTNPTPPGSTRATPARHHPGGPPHGPAVGCRRLRGPGHRSLRHDLGVPGRTRHLLPPGRAGTAPTWCEPPPGCRPPLGCGRPEQPRGGRRGDPTDGTAGHRAPGDARRHGRRLLRGPGHRGVRGRRLRLPRRLDHERRSGWWRRSPPCGRPPPGPSASTC